MSLDPEDMQLELVDSPVEMGGLVQAALADALLNDEDERD